MYSVGGMRTVVSEGQEIRGGEGVRGAGEGECERREDM